MVVCFLACWAQFLHCYTVQAPCLGSGATHCGLGLPIIYLRQFNRHAPGQANLGSLSLTLSSQVTPGCVHKTNLCVCVYVCMCASMCVCAHVCKIVHMCEVVIMCVAVRAIVMSCLLLIPKFAFQNVFSFVSKGLQSPVMLMV